MTKELSTKTLRKLLNKVLSESNSLTRSKRKAISKIAYMYSNFEEKQLTADNDIDIKTEIVVTSLSTGPNEEDRDFRECDATLSLRKSFGLEDDAKVIAVLNEGQLSALITALMNKYSELTPLIVKSAWLQIPTKMTTKAQPSMARTTVTSIDKIWLSNSEAQKYLGIGSAFFKRLRSTGQLRFYKIGTAVFYRKQDIDRLVERGRVI